MHLEATQHRSHAQSSRPAASVKTTEIVGAREKKKHDKVLSSHD